MPTDRPADASPSGAGPDIVALANLLDRFSRVAAASDNARELTNWLLDQVADMTGWPVADALLVDSLGAVTNWFSRRSTEMRYESYVLAATGLAMRTPTGLIDRVISTRRPGWVADIGVEANYPRAAAARAVGIAGVFTCPVIRGDRVVAVLQFLSTSPVAPSIEFLDVMTILGFLLGNSFDRMRIDGESADQPSRLHRIMDSGSGALVAMDQRGRVVEWAAGAERVFGWTREEAMYRSARDLLYPVASGAAGTGAGMAAGTGALGDDLLASDGGPIERRDVVLSRRDGSIVTVDVTRWPVCDEDGVREYWFCRLNSESAQRAAGSLVDELTGLANRAALMAGLQDALAADPAGAGAAGSDPAGADPDTGPATVLYLIGLDRFKEVDYSRSHDVADQALRIIADRLVAAAGSNGGRPALVARVAGDEFAVLLDEPAGANGIATTAQRLLIEISKPFDVAGRVLSMTAHVGAAQPLRGGSSRSWFGDADAALVRSKRGPAVGSSPAHENTTRLEIEGFSRRHGGSWRLSMPGEMRRALDGNEFELHFQPIYDGRDRSVIGAESLIRWHHPQHGLLLPGAFIDVAEQSGMIAPIGAWVLNAAAAQARVWQDAGLRIAVNLSARQLSDPGILARVAEAANSVDQSRGAGLTVEMTESVLMADPAVAATRIGQFRDLGVHIAIDDFGTGYSSLAYLKWFHVDIIKIDMSFVHGLPGSRTDTAIIKAVLDLAGELGLHVLAEGVETEEQWQALDELGCRYLQGFLFGRPMPASDFAELIASR